MAGEVSFKAYLHKEDEESKAEVRRFSLDQNVATSFLYLKEKLRSLFPALVVSQAFDVYWKDSDDDKVTICSDEELTIALTESRNEDIIKVYIKTSKAQPAPVNTTKGASHVGVSCDGCEMPITGYRYKCLGCHDYDLCGVCEAKGVHAEHFTLRIPTPLNMRHHFGHRLINKISKAARKAESRCPYSSHRYENNLAADFATNCTTDEAMPPRPHCFRSRSSASANAAQARRSSAQAQSCADPQECGQACGSSQDTPPGTAPGTVPAATITLDPAQIPNVIFNTLADFGIDLSHFFPAPQAPPTANSSEQPREEPKKKSETASKPADESSAPKIAKMANTTAPTAPPATNASATTNVNATANAGAQVNRDTNSLLDDWTVYNPNEAQETQGATGPEPIEIDLEKEINSSASSVVGEKEKSTSGSVASQPMEVVTAPAQAASTSNANLYPSLAGLPKNKKVAEALDQMLAMGFKNDDGWLTNLLNLQDGNIAKVLDQIQSAAQRK